MFRGENNLQEKKVSFCPKKSRNVLYTNQDKIRFLCSNPSKFFMSEPKLFFKVQTQNIFYDQTKNELFLSENQTIFFMPKHNINFLKTKIKRVFSSKAK